MDEVNWDEALEEANTTPRSALAGWLGKADEIAEVVIVIRFNEEDHVHYTAITEHDRSTVALLEIAKQLVFKSLEVID